MDLCTDPLKTCDLNLKTKENSVSDCQSVSVTHCEPSYFKR